MVPVEPARPVTPLVEVPCLLCGDVRGEPALEENGWRCVRCPACGLLRVSPRPSPEAIRALYAHDAPRNARHLLDLLGAARPPGRLLEIGAGWGHLLQVARERGWDVRAVEPDPARCGHLRDGLQIPAREEPLQPRQEGEAPVDAIVHCNVLSHLPDPVATFRVLRSHLAPGGVMLFETGNFADVSPAGLALVRRTEGFQLPEHLTFWGESSLAELLSRTGFRLRVIHRYDREVEKRVGEALRSIGKAGTADRWRAWLTYRLGAWTRRDGGVQTLVVLAEAGGG